MPVPGILTALLLAVFSLFPRPQAIGPSDIALNAIDSAGSDFDGYAVLANVTDSKLTISAGPGALNPKLCFIEIGQAGAALDAATITRLNNAVAAATARRGETDRHLRRALASRSSLGATQPDLR